MAKLVEKTVKIDGIEIGKGNDCFIIAEMGLSHDGSLGAAYAFIEAAAKTGVQAVKFQTHIASAESTKEEKFRVKIFPQDKTRKDYWERTAFSKDQWKELKEYTEKNKMTFLSSPFSLEAAELLYEIGIKGWKIGSGELNNLPFLIELTKFKLPFLLSTGMAYDEEIEKAVSVITEKKGELVLLQCTNCYPCPPEKWGLNLISEYKKKYHVPVGFSDHSGTIYAGLAAHSLGANVLEVHVTFHKSCFGPDVSSSLTFEELAELVKGTKYLSKALASPVEKNKEADSLKEMRQLFTKSIVAKKDLKADEVLTFNNIDFKKPVIGVPANRYKEVIGKRILKNLKKDDFIMESMVSEI